MTNVRKHASADQVWVRFSPENGNWRVAIEDDGRGFDPDNVAHTVADGGFGLFSIRECMLVLGGSLEIASAPGKGCKATLVMPLDSGEGRS